MPARWFPGPAGLPGGWGAAWWWLLRIQTVCPGDRRGGRIGIFAGLKNGWQFAEMCAAVAWGFLMLVSFTADPTPSPFWKTCIVIRAQLAWDQGAGGSPSPDPTPVPRWQAQDAL